MKVDLAIGRLFYFIIVLDNDANKKDTVYMTDI